jgi:hypothetical protein
VRQDGKASSPYLQIQRKVALHGERFITETAWCGIPKRNGGRRDPRNPPPLGLYPTSVTPSPWRFLSFPF